MTTDISSLVSDNLDIWTTAVERKSGAGRDGGKKLNLYGIEQLRKLILDLAVSGKLVPQDPGDEPASGLLKRINAASSTSSKRTQRPVKQPFAMPKGWSVLSFGELAKDIATGPFGTMIHKEDYILGGTPMINPSHMVEDRIVEDLSVSLSSTKAEELGSYSLEPGDIVFARRGEVGRLAIVTEREAGWLCGTGSFRARFFGNEVQPYLLKFFRSQKVRSFLGSESVGATMANLNQGILSELPISLPPLAEQKRIVAKVDQLMALCDALETESAAAMAAHQTLVEALLATLTSSTNAGDLATNWGRLETHFDTLFDTDASIETLKQTILELALMGKLVSQDTTEEPANALLTSEQRSVAAAKPFPLPDGWAWLALGKMGPILGGGTPSKANDGYWKGDIPWISPKDMKVDYISDAADKITQEALEGSAASLIPKSSLLIVVRGMILAHSFPAAITLRDVAINQDMKAISLGELHAPFVLSMMKGLKSRVVGMVDRSSHGTCKLVSSKIWALPLAIPPLAEQHRIAAKVDKLMALCDALKVRISDAATTQKHLADAISERAAA